MYSRGEISAGIIHKFDVTNKLPEPIVVEILEYFKFSSFGKPSSSLREIALKMAAGSP